MAQIRTHRHATFDVQSQRYVDFSDTPAEDLFTIPRSIVVPDHFTREGDSDLTKEEMQACREQFMDSVASSKAEYNDLCEMMPAEDARMCLPTAATVHMTMSLSLRSILHIMDMRSTADAQWEIRAVSNQMLEELREWCPITAELYDRHGPFAVAP
jgi:Predicted alternative thymidylate synthase